MPIERGNPDATVDNPAGYRITLELSPTRSILKERINKGETRRRRKLRTLIKSLLEGPPIVTALDNAIDLFAPMLPYVPFVHKAGQRIERDSPRVAKPYRPEFRANFFCIERF